jgi:hypothetical protein
VGAHRWNSRSAAVIVDGLPERDQVSVHVQWLVDVEDTDGGIVDGLQPPGDRYGADGVVKVCSGAGDPGDDRGREAVDRVPFIRAACLRRSGLLSPTRRSRWVSSSGSP